ncbi:MAG: hypothetical protein U0271_40790 [Polyangiaceae bacterium]
MARALGETDLLLVLAFDLAKLYADLGALDRRAPGRARRSRRARSELLQFFETACESVLADVALARAAMGIELALRFERARDGFAKIDAKRELAEEESTRAARSEPHAAHRGASSPRARRGCVRPRERGRSRDARALRSARRSRALRAISQM